MFFLRKIYILLIVGLTFALMSCSEEGNYEGLGSQSGGAVKLPTFSEKISAGGDHTCALSFDGGVTCWGRGDSGQLGYNKKEDSPFPVEVLDGNDPAVSLGGMIQISSGEAHTCALSSYSGVMCWGKGNFGQLGNNSFSDSPIPTSVVIPDENNINETVELIEITQISVGSYHNCALKSNGEVLCWGNGSAGQLGNNQSSDSSIPVTVMLVNENNNGRETPLSGIMQISSGYFHTCALRGDGGIFCWGAGSMGQLGDNQLIDSPIPVAVVVIDETNNNQEVALHEITQISVGSFHTCALKADEGVLCWGAGGAGQLGNNKSEKSPVPVAVMAIDEANSNEEIELSGVTQISVGHHYSCAVVEDDENIGTAFCWGEGSRGQLGRQLILSSPVALEVLTDSQVPLTHIKQVSTGNHHTCVLTDEAETGGRILCWGAGDNGRLGRGDAVNANDDSSFPVVVVKGPDIVTETPEDPGPTPGGTNPGEEIDPEEEEIDPEEEEVDPEEEEVDPEEEEADPEEEEADPEEEEADPEEEEADPEEEEDPILKKRRPILKKKLRIQIQQIRQIRMALRVELPLVEVRPVVTQVVRVRKKLWRIQQIRITFQVELPLVEVRPVVTQVVRVRKKLWIQIQQIQQIRMALRVELPLVEVRPGSNSGGTSTEEVVDTNPTDPTDPTDPNSTSGGTSTDGGTSGSNSGGTSTEEVVDTNPTRSDRSNRSDKSNRSNKSNRSDRSEWHFG